MANLPESAKWETGIYQLEESDEVLGGIDGVDNRQAKQLANRTNYLKTEQDKLKTEQDKLKTATAAATTEKSGTTQLSSSVTDLSETKAATTKAVKIAMDRANEAHTLADGKADATNPNFVLARYTDLDTQLGKDTRFFSFSGSSTIGAPASYGVADGVGWQVGDAGQRTQFSIAAGNNLYIRTDDNVYSTNETAWNNWNKFILDSDNASATTAGIVQLSSSLTDAGETKAATTKAVRDLDVKKANVSHTHIASQITDFSNAVNQLISGSYSKGSGWYKLQGGLVIQYGFFDINTVGTETYANNNNAYRLTDVTLPISFPSQSYAVYVTADINSHTTENIENINYLYVKSQSVFSCVSVRLYGSNSENEIYRLRYVAIGQ